MHTTNLVGCVLGFYVELPERVDQSTGTVDQVFVYRQAVHGELVEGVAVLVDDLHLLHDGRLSAFAGSYIWELDMLHCARPRRTARRAPLPSPAAGPRSPSLPLPPARVLLTQ